MPAGAVPHHRQFVGVGHAERDGLVHSSEHIQMALLEVAAHRLAIKRIAVAGAAAVIRFQHRIAFCREHLLVALPHDWTKAELVGIFGPSVQDDDKRIPCAWPVIERIKQDPFDGGAVGAFPRHNFKHARHPSCSLRVHVGQLACVLEHRPDAGNIDFGDGLRIAAHERDRRSILRDARARDHSLVGWREPGNRPGCRIQAIEVRPRPL